MSRICNITNSLEANSGPIFYLKKEKLEAYSAQKLRVDFIVKAGTSCVLTVKHLK